MVDKKELQKDVMVSLELEGPAANDEDDKLDLNLS